MVVPHRHGVGVPRSLIPVRAVEGRPEFGVAEGGEVEESEVPAAGPVARRFGVPPGPLFTQA